MLDEFLGQPPSIWDWRLQHANGALIRKGRARVERALGVDTKQR